MALIDHMKHLRTACAVALTGSSVNAAQALHVSQSSVVRSVLAVEAALQSVLFDRSAKGMLPTPQFQELLVRCNRAFQHIAITPFRKSAHHALPDWMRCRFALGLGVRHIRVLSSLAVTGSETLTAQHLGVSQSAVHQTLVQLEHLSDHMLFARSRQHGLRMTELGEQLLHKCKMCEFELAQADEVLASWSGKVTGRLVIGTLPFSTGPLLSKVVDRVMQALPGVNVTVVDGTYDALIHQLRQAEVDVMLGALRPDFSMQGLMQETLFVDRLAVVARSAHPLARKKSLSWRDLRNAQWIMPMPNTPAQSVFEKALQRGGIAMPVSQLRVNSALMMQSLLLQSDRLAMMSPRQIQREIEARQMVVLPLSVPHAERSIGLVRRADLLFTPAMQQLLTACHEVAAEFVQQNKESFHR